MSIETIEPSVDFPVQLITVLNRGAKADVDAAFHMFKYMIPAIRDTLGCKTVPPIKLVMPDSDCSAAFNFVTNEIRVSMSDSLVAMALGLVHEMIHYHQYETKKMHTVLNMEDRTKHVHYWNGQAYQHNLDVDPVTLPWEIEAYALQGPKLIEASFLLKKRLNKPLGDTLYNTFTEGVAVLQSHGHLKEYEELYKKSNEQV